VRWERDTPMALWQLDIVGGVFLADGTEAKVVTGVDDHSRYCVICQVVPRATGRAVCLSFAGALRRFGFPVKCCRTMASSSLTVSGGAGGAVRPDLPGPRDHPPADSAPLANHDRQDRAVPWQLATRARN
jgi:hypothetical protein